MAHSPVALLKARLREETFERRDALDPQWRAEASARVAERALGLPDLRAVEPVGGFWPMRSEIDPRPLMESLFARGQALALSQVTEPVLTFRLWQPGDPLVKGGFGVSEPAPDAAKVHPRALLVPLACFDRRGYRLGYGKAHFDRAIAALRARQALLTIGLAFCVQEVPEVPVEAHDQRLDIVVTEAEVIRPGEE